MLKTILLSAMCISVATSTSTVHLFQTDYDADSYAITPVSFDIPDTVPEGWFPIRAVSEYLPITVTWDGMTQEVVVVSDAMMQFRPTLAERRFKASRLPESLCIRRGVTYCSPQFLTGMLPGVGFLHEGQVYAFAGERTESQQIRGGDRFRSWCLTAMYRVKLVAPEEYGFIREHLEGIAETDDGPMGATAYIYPAEAVCYVVDKTAYGAQLAGYIGHEAYHIMQHRAGKPVTEKEVNQFEDTIIWKLIGQK